MVEKERGFAKTEISLAGRGELFPRWVEIWPREEESWLRVKDLAEGREMWYCGRDLAKREAIRLRAERFYLDT